MIRLIALLAFAWTLNAQELIPYFGTTLTGNQLQNNLLAYWRFEEASGNAADSSGNGRTLTLNGTLSSVGGVVANARQYTDTDETDYFWRASEAVFAFSGDFTITAWVNLDTDAPATDDKMIISRGDFGGSTFSWALMFDNASPTDKFLFYWSTTGTFSGGQVVSFDTGTDIESSSGWYFVVARRTGSTLGVSATHISELSPAADTTATVSGSFYNNGSNALRVGDLEGSDIHDMRGVIDELGAWSVYLSDCQLRWLFTQKDGTFTYPNFDALPCANP